MAECTTESSFELNRTELCEVLALLDSKGTDLHPKEVALQKQIRRVLARKRWFGTATLTITSTRHVEDRLVGELFTAIGDHLQKEK